MPSPPAKTTATRPRPVRRSKRRIGRWWPYVALVIAFCVALALIGFTAATGWEIVAIDGWGTALLFTIGWGTINYYVTVAKPARARLRNAVAAILAELQINYMHLAQQDPERLRALLWDMFDACGADVLGALDHDAAMGLIGLYGDFKMLRVYGAKSKVLRLYTGLNKRQRRRLFNTFIDGIQALDLSLDHQVGLVREAFDRAYAAPAPPWHARLRARL